MKGLSRKSKISIGLLISLPFVVFFLFVQPAIKRLGIRSEREATSASESYLRYIRAGAYENATRCLYAEVQKVPLERRKLKMEATRQLIARSKRFRLAHTKVLNWYASAAEVRYDIELQAGRDVFVVYLFRVGSEWKVVGGYLESQPPGWGQQARGSQIRQSVQALPGGFPVAAYDVLCSAGASVLR